MPSGFSLTEQAGVEIFHDRKTFYNGSSALRVVLSREFEEATALLTMEVAVHPRRCYRLRCRVKTEGIKKSGDVFPLLV